MTLEKWGQVRGALQQSIGAHNFSAWIEPIAFQGLENRTATFLVPTNFIGAWVSKNYGDLILRHLISAGVTADRVEFNVDPGTTAKAGNANAAPRAEAETLPEPVHAAAGSVGKDPFTGSILNPSYTFDNFVVGKPNELAHAAARRAAEAEDASFTPLFLYGGVGLGKTHLMQAIAWELRSRTPEAKVLYLSAEQFMYRFVSALRRQDTLNFKSQFRSCDVLMVDDVQFLAGKDSTQEEFFHTFNALAEMGKRVIITGDTAPIDIDELDRRIASRLQSGLVVDIHPTDFELRLGVLQHKAELARAKNPDLMFKDGVLEFIARKVSTDIRTIEGALTRLVAFADLVKNPITIEMAQDALSDILRASDRKVTMDQIIKKTCEYYNIRQADMLGTSRQRAYARPRQMAMYLCKKLTQRSYPEIAMKLGGRDHTTVLYGVRKIEELKAKDSQIAEDAEILRRALEA